MQHISLFSGIGGFDLGFARSGIDTVLACEKDAKARGVLIDRFDTEHVVDDVCEVTGDQLREAGLTSSNTVLSGGFPCQQISIAGSQAGLNKGSGTSSSLFWEMARVIEEFGPEWFVIENVPNLLSLDKGSAMELVLGELQRLGYSVAWRVLDAQYFGVPQRRRRVFIVGHKGNDELAIQALFGTCANDVIASGPRDYDHGIRPQKWRSGGFTVSGELHTFRYSESCDTTESDTKLKDILETRTDPKYRLSPKACAGIMTRAKRRNRTIPEPLRSALESVVRGLPTDEPLSVEAPATGRTVTTRMWTYDDTVQDLLIEPDDKPLAFAKDAGGFYNLTLSETCPTLQTTTKPAVYCPDKSATITAGSHRPNVSAPGRRQEDDTNLVASKTATLLAGQGDKNRGEDAAVGNLLIPEYIAEKTGTLQSLSGGGQRLDADSAASGQLMAFAVRGREEGSVPEVHDGGQTVGALRSASGGSSRDFVSVAQNQRGEVLTSDSTFGSMTTGGGKPGQGYPCVSTRYTVRRLTPTETERLQGFPDGHTLTSAGKPQSDSARYKQHGNAVAVPVVAWIGQRIVTVASSPTTGRK